MYVLLDTNVVLDSVLQRPPWHKDADAMLQAATSGQITCAATSLTVATVFYVARKAAGIAKARAAVQKCLSGLTILPIDKQSLVDADASPGVDFEDNIVIAAAVTAAVDAVITRNVAHFSHSPIPAWDPPELLRRLAAAATPPPASGPATGAP